MKTEILSCNTIISFAIAIKYLSISVFAHDIDVHAKISEAAAKSSPALLRFVGENFPGTGKQPTDQWFLDYPLLKNQALMGPLSWIRAGSRFEDGLQSSLPSQIRCKNHFYNPLSAAHPELTDESESPGGLGFKFNALPIGSFTWGSKRGGGGILTPNKYTWQDARDYEYRALIDPSKIVRDLNWALMFESVGHVMHLNQDSSQPGHTRNDNHVKKKYIEPYGNTKYIHKANGFPVDSSYDQNYWFGHGFSKLRDFWDRDLYNGQDSKPLLQHEREFTWPVEPTLLGIAEYSNGNYLSEDALYKELYRLADGSFATQHAHYFPFPSLETTTNFRNIINNISQGAATVLMPDGQLATRVYLTKVADGNFGPYEHSVLTYSGLRYVGFNSPGGMFTSQYNLPVGITIADDKVLDNYHSRLIPTAIEYSTGILEHFFRGKMDAAMSWDGAKFKVKLTNRSGQSFQGGAFSLLREQANAGGTRETIQPLEISYPGTLAVDADLTIRFDEPATPVKDDDKFFLFFQGTIGWVSPAALDPVDAGVAIAAKSVTCNCPPIHDPPAPAFLPQLPSTYPARVRIKNFDSEVKAKLVGCSSCIGPAGPEWDGTFPLKNANDEFEELFWDTAGDLTIGGKGLRGAFSYVTWNGDGEWGLIIFCTTQQNSIVEIWSGVKDSGDTPEGRYTPDSGSGACVGDPIDPPCIVVEYY